MPSIWEDRGESDWGFTFGGKPFRGRDELAQAQVKQGKRQAKTQQGKEVRQKTGRRNKKRAS